MKVHYLALAIVSLAISLTFIIFLWLKHKEDSFLKKTLWSLMLFVPLFGWLFYGALYEPLGKNAVHARGDAGGWWKFGAS